MNADWTQAPSGRVRTGRPAGGGHAIPDVYERVRPRPASPFAQSLRLGLIDAAPEDAEDPVVVVLSPGIHLRRRSIRAYLANGSRLSVGRAPTWWSATASSGCDPWERWKRVDVVLRRVDAEYTDPLDLRPDSRLGGRSGGGATARLGQR